MQFQDMSVFYHVIDLLCEFNFKFSIEYESLKSQRVSFCVTALLYPL